jgi:predicted aldo/keto reductase-like oxidoreductase
MRLPDDEEGARIVRRAAELGINYFETSEGYCGGRSEIKVGMGLAGRRESVYISTKATMRPGTTADEIKRRIEASLKRLGTDYIDFYQVWDYRASDYETVVKKGGALDVLEDIKAQGVIHHIGVTSHDTNEEIKRLLDTDRFESVTLSYHMLKRVHEPLIEYAASKQIGVVIMTPLAGGLLATPSEIITELIPGQHHSTASAALSFVMSNPFVSTIPSGMKSIEEVEDNVRTWIEFQPLTSDERTQLIRSLEEYQSLGEKFCTQCGYCMPCNNGIDISRLFKIYNMYRIFGLREWAIRAYQKINAKSSIDRCTECGQCEAKCPNNIPIIKQLKEVAKQFEGVLG